MQTRALRESVKRRGWKVAGEYVDVGISGTKEKRPELDRLMSDSPAPVRCSGRLEARPLRTLSEPLASRARNIPRPRH